MFIDRSKKILEKFEGSDIIRSFAGANFFGQESRGLWQFRGNGVLILTSKELFFEMWMPKKVSNIPIKNIVKVEKAKWHLRKSKNRLLLKIIFINEEGQTDSAAWLIRDLDDWINALDRLMQKK
ncbi:MAG: hypothetical protein FK734_09600 [Asgard group archaeon]|nr:hypothetical protein [Asgard group archaeon]